MKEELSKKKDSLKEDPPKMDLPRAKNSESTSTESSSNESLSPSKVNACSSDDWGSLDFTDSHVGQYQVYPIHLRFRKISLISATKDDYVSIKPSDTYHVDNIFYTKPPTFKDLHDIYGPRYNLASKIGYDGKGYGPNEQGIQIPLELGPHHQTID